MGNNQGIFSNTTQYPQEKEINILINMEISNKFRFLNETDEKQRLV